MQSGKNEYEIARIYKLITISPLLNSNEVYVVFQIRQKSLQADKLSIKIRFCERKIMRLLYFLLAQ